MTFQQSECRFKSKDGNYTHEYMKLVTSGTKGVPITYIQVVATHIYKKQD